MFNWINRFTGSEEKDKIIENLRQQIAVLQSGFHDLRKEHQELYDKYVQLLKTLRDLCSP